MLFLSKLIPVFFYPLGFALLLILLSGALLCMRQTRQALWCLLLSGLTLFLFSTEIVAFTLAKSLERQYLPPLIADIKGDAIVSLGGAGRPKRFPRDQAEFNEAGERLFHSIRLYKAGVAPWVIATGGGIDFILPGQVEADDMRAVMVEFGLPDSVLLLEGKARNTYENALYTKALLAEKGIGLNVVLVTSGMHMPRSVAIFKKAGFLVVPAPTDYLIEDKSYNWYSCLPRAENLCLSTQAIKEWIGILAYKMLGRL